MKTKGILSQGTSKSIFIAVFFIAASYCVSSADVVYMIEATISENDYANLKQVSASYGFPSDFPSSDTGYKIEIRSFSGEVLFRENLGFSFITTEEEDLSDRNLADSPQGNSVGIGTISSMSEEGFLNPMEETKPGELNTSEVSLSGEVNSNGLEEAIINESIGIVDDQQSIGELDAESQLLFVRVPAFQTATKILIYHLDKVILDIDLSKELCNKNTVCDLGENDYNCPQDCALSSTTANLSTDGPLDERKEKQSTDYLFIGVALLVILIIIFFLVKRGKK
jgi:hypothetical protein